MSRFFFAAALVFFFLAAVDSSLLPRPTAWGLVALAAGFLAGGVPVVFWRRPMVVG